MNVFRLSLRNLSSRPLSTLLSLILLTFSVGLIALLLQVNRQIQEQMGNNIRGIDMVVGAKGSPLQLILSAVYHIDVPTGNIQLSEVENLKRNRLIKSSIPLSYGDSHKGYRIVGTDHNYPNHYNAVLREGRLWQNSFEVSLGATVASALKIELGDTFSGEHGLLEGGESHDEQAYTVVGIFEFSNSVIDQLFLTATESVWESHHSIDEDQDEHAEEHSHHEEHGEEEPHEQHVHDSNEANDEREITALLVEFRNPIGILQLPRMINENTNMQAAVPAYEINRLFGLMGMGIDTLKILALIIMIVSGLSVFISLYNALRARQHEMALMRTYGASPGQLFRLVLMEGLMLSLMGFLFGIIFSRLGLFFISKMIATNYHYQMEDTFLMQEELWLLLLVLITGIFASILPAIRAFRLDISKTLAHA